MAAFLQDDFALGVVPEAQLLLDGGEFFIAEVGE